jgi:large exoprotein involved in heme utilization and adhesion
MLTAAPVSAFGFVSSSPAPVSFSGSQMGVPAGAGLNVIAGNVTLDSATGDTTTPGATLFTQSGELTIFSAASAGEVPFSLVTPGAGYGGAAFSALGTVSLGDGSFVAIDGPGGGAMVIRAGVISLDDSTILSLNDGSLAGADLTVDAENALTLRNGGAIVSIARGNGSGGNVFIRAGSLDIAGSQTTTAFSEIDTEADQGTGNAGALNIVVSGALDIVAGGEISSETTTAGQGGNVTIDAGSLDTDGSATPGLFTGITAQSGSEATGDAGDLNLTVTGALDIEGGAEIFAFTLSSGNDGNVTIHAGSMNIDGAATPTLVTEIGAESGPGATGSAGSFNITVTGALDIEGGDISADTFSSGNAGDVTIHAGSMNINGAATPTLFSGIRSDSDIDATGNAGDLDFTITGALDIESGGRISTDTTSSGEGGDINIRAGSMTIDGAATPTLFTGIRAESDVGATGNAGDLNVTVARALDIESGGEITTDTSSSGKGGNVSVQADSLTIEGSATLALATAIGADSDPGATGNAGDLTVNVAGAITLLGDGVISSTTFSSGNGGSLTVSSGSVDIEGVATPDGSTCGIFDSADQGITGDSGGMAGDLSVSVTGALFIANGGEVSGGTFSSGNGGKVMIQAGSLEIDGGVAQNAFTGIGAESSGAAATGFAGDLTVNVAGAISIFEGGEISVDTFSSGKSGNLTVEAGSVDIKSGGEISADTFSSGEGGNLTIKAGSLDINGLSTLDEDTGISAKSEDGATGNAGDLNVSVSGAIDIKGGDISAGTFSPGKGGNLTIRAGSVNIDGSAGPTLFTGIATQSEPGATGNAGDLNLTVAGAIDIEGAGEITATTFSSGKGGNLSIQAESVDIDGSAAPRGRFTGIIAASYATRDAGAAGSISIRCDDLAMNAGGEISTTAVAAGAGDITINVRQSVTVEDQGSISSSAGVSGGNITIQAGELLYLLDSSITATAGADRTAHGEGSNPNAGNGGNITIDPEFIVLDDSLISANAAIGQGGNIVLESAYYLNSGSTITATGATSGTVTITSPELDLSGALVGLPSAPVGAETQLQETCAMAITGDFSSFLAIGQGDVEAGPDEAQGGTGDGTDDRRDRAGHPKSAHLSGIGL